MTWDPSTTFRWIGLIRHGEMDYAAPNRPVLTTAGEKSVRDVGRVFAEFLDFSGIPADQVVVHDVGTDASRETANVIRRALRQPESDGTTRSPCERLAPDKLSAYTATQKDLDAAWDAVSPGLLGPSYLLLVGHDPQMSWLLRAIAGRRARRLSLAKGELILVENPGSRTPTIRWAFSPTDKDTSEDLRDKIKAKLEAAKVLGAFITALITFSATQLLDPEVVDGGFAVALATVLYFVTLFSYDQLLMPTRFRGARPATRGAPARERFVRRPPGSDTTVLYQNMVHVWNWAFIPATLAAGTGVTLLTIAFAQPEGWDWATVAGAIAVVVVVGFVVRFWARPRLGVSD